MTPILFAVFYHDRGDGAYLPYLDILAQSVARATQDTGKIVLLTDNAHTPYETFPVVLDPAVPLMLERLRVQREYVEAAPIDAPIVICDPDVIVQRDPAWLFEEPFDVLLTIRPEHDEWILGGLALTRGQAPGAVRYYRKIETEGRTMRPLKHPFYDQIAPCRWACDLPREPGTHTYRGVQVRLLSASTHHWWPKSKSVWGGRLISQTFCHFKGTRKSYMAEYWRALSARKRSYVPGEGHLATGR